MGAVQSGFNAGKSVYNGVSGTLLPIAYNLMEVTRTARFSFLLFIPIYLISLGLAVFAAVVVFIFTLIRYFIYSFIFNWQSLVIIIIIFMCIWVISIIWGMVRSGVNQGILPGILFFVSNILNPIIRIFKKLLKMVGTRLPFDEIDEDSLSEGMPTLLSIAMMVLRPVIEMILSPLRASTRYDPGDKCKIK